MTTSFNEPLSITMRDGTYLVERHLETEGCTLKLEAAFMVKDGMQMSVHQLQTALIRIAISALQKKLEEANSAEQQLLQAK